MARLMLLVATAALTGCTAPLLGESGVAVVSIVSWAEVIGGDGYRYVIGEVENQGPDAADHPGVVARAGDVEVGGGEGLRYLLAGERAPFMIRAVPNAAALDVEVSTVHAARGPGFHNDALRVHDVSVRPDNGSLALRATLVNVGTAPADGSVYVVLRNATGGVVGVAEAVHDVNLNAIPPIRPGATVPLVGLFQAVTGPYVAVEAFVDARPWTS